MKPSSNNPSVGFAYIPPSNLWFRFLDLFRNNAQGGCLHFNVPHGQLKILLRKGDIFLNSKLLYAYGERIMYVDFDPYPQKLTLNKKLMVDTSTGATSPYTLPADHYWNTGVWKK